MYLLILLISVFLIVALFIDAGILLWLKKVFKIKDPTYKNSIKIIFISGVVNLTIGIFSEVLGIIATLLVFHYLLKKYYGSNWEKSLGIYVVSLVIFTALIFITDIPIRIYIVEPFIVKGEAMSPTYGDGDYLLINKFSNKFDRSDIIIVRNPKEQDQFLIKRIIGLPNDKVEIKNGDIFINGKILNEEYIDEKTDSDISIVLENNQYFILGDNRDESSDSRSFGSVSADNIEGKVFYKAFNLAE